MSEKDYGEITYKVRADTSGVEKDIKAANTIIEKTAESGEKKVSETVKKENKKRTDEYKKSGEEVSKISQRTNEKVKEHTKETSEKIKEQSENTKNKVNKDFIDVEKYGKEKFSSLAKGIGMAFTAATAAVAALGTAAIKGAAVAETAFAKTKTLLIGNKNDIAQLENELKGVSNRTGTNFKALSESAYEALSAGVPQDKVVGFVESSVKLSRGGFADMATSVDVVTTALNAYGLKMEEAGHIQDVLITTQNKGKTTVAELGAKMGEVIPTANALGVSFDQLGALFSTVTINGVATAQSATYVNAMLNELAKGGTTANKALAEAVKGTELQGKSFKQLTAEGYNVADIMLLLKDYCNATGKEMMDVFGSVEAAKSAQILADKATAYSENLEEMRNSMGATAKAAEIMEDTFEFRFNKLKNSFQNTLADFGKELMPMAETFVSAMEDSLKGTGGLFDTIKQLNDDGTLEAIGKGLADIATNLIGVMANAIKTALQYKDAIFAIVAAMAAFKTMMAIGSAITAVSNVIKSFSANLRIAKTAQDALNLSMKVNPATLIASAIAGVIAVIGTLIMSAGNAAKKIDELRESAKQLNNEAKGAANAADEVKKLTDEYEKLAGQSTLTEDGKQRLFDIQEQLIKTYGIERGEIDLVNGKYEEQLKILGKLSGEKGETARLKSEKAHREMQKAEAAETKATVALPVSFLEDDQTLEILKSVASKNKDLFYFPDSGAPDVPQFVAGNSEEKKKAYKALIEAFSAAGYSDSTDFAFGYDNLLNNATKYSEIVDQNKEIISLYDEFVNGITDKNGEIDNSNKTVSKSFIETQETVSALKTSMSGALSTFDETVDKTDILKSALEKLKNGTALSAAEFKKLIEISPELVKSSKVTADGYYIEVSALEKLNGTLYDSVSVQINAEIDKTKIALEQSKKRIEAYEKERQYLDNITPDSVKQRNETNLNNEKNAVKELEQMLLELEGKKLLLNAPANGGGTSGGGSSYSSNSTAKSEIKNTDLEAVTLLTEAFKKLKDETDLSYDEMKRLISVYPELQDKVTATEDGFNITLSNIEKLIDTYILRAKTVLEGEIERLKAELSKATKAGDKKLSKELSSSILEKETELLGVSGIKKSLYKNDKPEKKSKGGSIGEAVKNSISITSFVPTIWDNSKDANKKLKLAGVAEDLIGNSKTNKIINAIQGIEKGASASVSKVTEGVSKSAKDTELGDILKEIKALKKVVSDLKGESKDIVLKTDNITLAKATVQGINTITKTSGKSPLKF